MIPYYDKNELILAHNNLNQDLTINKISKKMLDNDLVNQDYIDYISNGDIAKLRLADRGETMLHETIEKSIVPAHIMSLSATDDDIFRWQKDDRFITSKNYKKYIYSKLPPTLLVDLFADRFKDHFPNDDELLEKVLEYIGNTIFPDGTLLYVRYVYTRVKKKKHWSHFHKKTTRYYRDYLHYDTFRMENGKWKILHNRHRQTNRI